MSHYRMKDDPIAPRSRFHDSSFGRLFPELGSWKPDLEPKTSLEDHFLAYAKAKMIEQPLSPDERGNVNNNLIPVGYTYFGQFVDHDITFDPTPLSEADADPDRLHNLRTPQLDLDSVYGRGPDEQPYLYEYDKEERFLRFTGKFLVGELIKDTKHPDLPRNKSERALIGDMRNDENSFVAQVHLAFLLAHNRLVDRAMAAGGAPSGKTAFEEARRTLRWLYQWVVWNDFVKRISESNIHKSALQEEILSGKSKGWRLGFREVYDWKKQPFMPLEFSMAAYRFGHSMVRDSYRSNGAVRNGLTRFIPLFSNRKNVETLRGFRALDITRMIQWDWFLPMNSSEADAGFPQPSRPIDTKLSRSLGNLPESGEAIAPMLAARNLVRGVRNALPSGPAVAKELGATAIDIRVEEEKQLWHYILREAEVTQGGRKLGEVGSKIVCAVFAGILKGDRASWVNMEPGWTPDEDRLLKAEDKIDGDWSLAAIIRLSGLPVTADQFREMNTGSGGGYDGGSGGGFRDDRLRRTPDEDNWKRDP